MTTTTDSPIDAEFEADLREMLQRRAGDVRPALSSVRRLQADETTAPPASTASDWRGGRRAMRLGGRGRRPLVAAAAAVVVLSGGIALAVATTSSDGGHHTAVGAAASEEQAFPAPGSEGWDPATAPPAWPVVGEAELVSLVAGPNTPNVDLHDPAAVVSAYLDAVASPVAISATEPTVAADGRTATADWESAEGPAPDEFEPTYSGTIFLRRVTYTTDRPSWVVVGAATRPTSAGAEVLADVRSDGERLRFTVASDTATGEAIAVRARVNDVPVSVGGEPLPQGESPDPMSGELVRFDDSHPRELELDVESGDRVEILVRHVGGTWLSLTHMAVDVPAPQEAQPGPSTSPSSSTVAPPTSTDAAAPPAQTTPTRTAGTGTVEHVEGTYRGTEHFSLTTGGCPMLDHVLDSTFSLSDGSTWRYHSDYCGSVEGDLWTGTGTFTFTTSAGDTITGTFDSAARLPSDGEPFELRITGGTGTYGGASGSCRLDNHLLQFEFGTQEQFGPFTCDITR